MILAITCVGSLNKIVLPISIYTDLELLKAIRQNDEEAFNELFQRYWQKMYELAYPRVRSKEVATEIVQDLFISLWNNRLSQTISHLPSYLYFAVKNKALNYIASQIAREKHWDYYKKFIQEAENATEYPAEFVDLIDAIENGIEHLPEKSKEVFRLSRLEGRSIPEIADTLNLSEKAIQYHLTKSLKKLRLHLKDFVIIAVLFLDLLF